MIRRKSEDFTLYLNGIVFNIPTSPSTPSLKHSDLKNSCFLFIFAENNQEASVIKNEYKRLFSEFQFIFRK
ncbi:MAG TPA: hypothetical protein DCQ68_15450 [Chryseobacterium indologenes]|nr:hypothetical protein [Chryseobacterium indologenes]